MHISRGNNSHADSLATLVLNIYPSASWMDPILAYQRNGILPKDKKEFEQIKCRSSRYWVSEEEKLKLYKRSYLGPYPLCVHLEAVELLLEKLHEGICGSHTWCTEPLLRDIGSRGCISKRWKAIRKSRTFAQWGIDIVGPLFAGHKK